MRKPFYKRILVLMVAWFSSILTFNTQAQALKIGDSAPSFELANQDGELISLERFQGHWVVLYFYPKNDTPGCTTEACSFRDNINRLIAQAVHLEITLTA